ncbi:unnamed protein product [marine sediment metagenome]|uniref:Uncharacterized protein n=1 Tax=marine sediment metagenome TaxID=412755 RepID=X0YG99_9ZZZZ
MSYHERGYHRVNRIVTTLFEGRTVAKGVTTELIGALAYVTVTVPNLNFIEEVLNIQWHTDPPIDFCDVGNKNISGNVVGVTISGTETGTTLSLEIIAIGV